MTIVLTDCRLVKSGRAFMEEKNWAQKERRMTDYVRGVNADFDTWQIRLRHGWKCRNQVEIKVTDWQMAYRQQTSQQEGKGFIRKERGRRRGDYLLVQFILTVKWSIDVQNIIDRHSRSIVFLFLLLLLLFGRSRIDARRAHLFCLCTLRLCFLPLCSRPLIQVEGQFEKGDSPKNDNDLCAGKLVKQNSRILQCG